jgi:hypothetical protein
MKFSATNLGAVPVIIGLKQSLAYSILKNVQLINLLKQNKPAKGLADVNEREVLKAFSKGF